MSVSELLAARRSTLQDEIALLRSTPSLSDFNAHAHVDAAEQYVEAELSEERSAALGDPARLRHLHEVLASTRRPRVARSVSPAFNERFEALEREVAARHREEDAGVQAKLGELRLSSSAPKVRRSPNYWRLLALTPLLQSQGFLPPAAAAAAKEARESARRCVCC